MTDRYVLISGAAGGIGRSAARLLSEAGYRVLAGVLNQAEAASLTSEAIDGLTPLILDVSREASVDAALQTVTGLIGNQGRLVALVNNAGVNWNGPLQYLSVAEIRQTLDVNLLGAILLTRAALPLLRQNASRVVFTGSAMGLMASPTVSVYAATKFALEGLSDGLRVELAPLGVHVSLIEPGVVRTPMTASSPGTLEKMLERMSADDRRRYEHLMRKIVDMSTGPKSGVEAAEVGRVILEAVQAQSPRSRYQVGGDSKALSWLRHLPDAARDAMQRKIFGL